MLDLERVDEGVKRLNKERLASIPQLYSKLLLKRL